MRRRHLLPIALCLPLTRLAWAQQQPTAPEPEEEDAPQALPHYKVSAARLQAAVAQGAAGLWLDQSIFAGGDAPAVLQAFRQANPVRE
jgi:hypothetical protein